MVRGLIKSDIGPCKRYSRSPTDAAANAGGAQDLRFRRRHLKTGKGYTPASGSVIQEIAVARIGLVTCFDKRTGEMIGMSLAQRILGDPIFRKYLCGSCFLGGRCVLGTGKRNGAR